MGMHVDGESEIGGKISADFVPVIAGVVGTHYVPVLLHEEQAGTLGVHGDVVNAVADFGVGIGNVLGVEAFVDGLPGLAAVVGAKGARGRDRDVNSLGIARRDPDTNAPQSFRPCGQAARKLPPRCSAIS